MPALTIHFVDNHWVADIANTNIRYQFYGQTLQEEVISVRSVADDMARNYTGNMNTFFEGGDEIPNGELVQQLYGDTDILIYETNIIYGTVGDEMLIDDLEAAGEALIAAAG